jgi:hypothetical protein
MFAHGINSSFSDPLPPATVGYSPSIFNGDHIQPNSTDVTYRQLGYRLKYFRQIGKQEFDMTAFDDLITTITNHAPTQSTITYPVNNDNTIDAQTTITPTWTPSTDQDGDWVRYDAHIKSTSDASLDKIIKNVNATTLTLPAGTLKDNTTYTMDVTSKDNDKYTPSSTVTFTTKSNTPVNHAPVVASHMGSRTVLKNSGETFVAKPSNVITDPDGDVLINSVTSTNSSIAGYIRNDSLFILPAANFTGTGYVTLKRTDPYGLFASDPLDVTVNDLPPVNHAPVVAIPLSDISIAENTKKIILSSDVKRNITDPDGDPLAYSVSGAADLGIQLSGDTLSINPSNNFYGNNNPAILKATDPSGESVTTTAYINITYVDYPPSTFAFTKPQVDTMNHKVSIPWTKSTSQNITDTIKYLIAITEHGNTTPDTTITTMDTTTTIDITPGKFKPQTIYDITGKVTNNRDTVSATNIESFTTPTKTGVEDIVNNNPQGYALSQNYPNPFNPTTTICYNLVKVGNLDKVNIRVYDVLGREIAVLVNEEKPAGEYRVTFNASHLPSGVYFYRLSAGNYVDMKKMLLVK